MKNFNILKGIAWITGKMGVVKKCGDTITAFLESLEYFQVMCEKIWIDEKNIKNNSVTDSASISTGDALKEEDNEA